jgi:phytoene dehydrogenase-like protein
VDYFALTPQKIEKHFGISRGHIHLVLSSMRLCSAVAHQQQVDAGLHNGGCPRSQVDNSLSFLSRMPYATPITGLYSASAGSHPAGSVMGCAGHNAAWQIITDLGLEPYWTVPGPDHRSRSQLS